MKAAVLRTVGGPHDLEILDWPEPTPTGDEVLLRVVAVCANRTDLLGMRQQNVGRSAPRPFIGGLDPAGIVVSVGKDARSIELGARMVARPLIPCGSCRFCVGRDDSMCERATYVGIHRPGGFAEFVVLPERALFSIPEGVTFDKASAAAHGLPVALHLLKARGEVGPSDSVLVLGAAGGLGSACVQVAQLLGAQVIAAGSSPERLQRVADVTGVGVVPYEPLDHFDRRVLAATGPTGITVVVDNIGNPALFEASIRVLDKGGRILSCGAVAGGHVTIDLGTFYRKQLRLIGAAGATAAEFLEALRLVASGAVSPVIDGVWPLERISEAFHSIETRINVGKPIIRVAPGGG